MNSTKTSNVNSELDPVVSLLKSENARLKGELKSKSEKLDMLTGYGYMLVTELIPEDQEVLYETPSTESEVSDGVHEMLEQGPLMGTLIGFLTIIAIVARLKNNNLLPDESMIGVYEKLNLCTTATMDRENRVAVHIQTLDEVPANTLDIQQF